MAAAVTLFELLAKIRTEGKAQVVADFREMEKRAVDAAKSLEGSFGAGLKRTFSEAGQAANLLGAQLGGVARGFTLVGAAATAAAGGIALSTKAAIRFSDEFAKSRVFLSEYPSQIQAVEKGLKGLDARLGSTTELLPTFRKALLDSADPKVALEMTRIAAAFAKVSGATPEQAVEALGSLMDSFGVKADRAATITDALFTIMKNGGGSVEELVTTFPRLADAASESGVTLNELGATLVTLGQIAGSDPKKNVQALLTLFQNLAVAQQKFVDRGVDVDALKRQYGPLVGILQAIKQAATDVNGELSPERLSEFGVTGRNRIAVMKLLNDELKTLTENAKKFGAEAPGAVDRGFKQITQTTGEEFKRLGAELEKIKLRIGSLFEIPATASVKFGADLAEFIRQGIDNAERDLAQGGATGIARLLTRIIFGNAVSKRVFGETPGPANRDELDRAEGQPFRETPPSVAGPKREITPPSVLAARRARALAGRVGRFELAAREARRLGQVDISAEQTIAGIREQIKGLNAEIAITEKSTEGTKESRQIRVEELKGQVEAAERQITDVHRDAAAERKRISEQTAKEVLQIQKDVTAAILEEIKKTNEFRDRLFATDVALGRKTVEEQITRALAVSEEDRSRSYEERFEALKEADRLERQLIEDNLEFRKALGQASIQDEIAVQRQRVAIVARGSQLQIDALRRVAELTRQQRDEARGFLGELLGMSSSDTVSRSDVDKDVSRTRQRDQNVLNKYNIGGRVNRAALIQAVGRQSFFERLDLAGGPGAATNNAFGSLTGMFVDNVGDAIRGTRIDPSTRLGLYYADPNIAPDRGFNATEAYYNLGIDLTSRKARQRQADMDYIDSLPGPTNVPTGEELRRRLIGPQSSLGIGADDVARAVDAVQSGLVQIERLVSDSKTRIARSFADQVSDFIAQDLEVVRG
jgi:TP901 family phage tail tape measure protein